MLLALSGTEHEFAARGHVLLKGRKVEQCVAEERRRECNCCYVEQPLVNALGASDTIQVSPAMELPRPVAKKVPTSVVIAERYSEKISCIFALPMHKDAKPTKPKPLTKERFRAFLAELNVVWKVTSLPL